MNIPPDLLRRVDDAVIETYLRAQSLFNRQFELPEIKLTLRGCTAGLAWEGKNVIELNPVFLASEPDFISRTVPHECAHLLNYAMNGPRVKPHGDEWKAIMLALGHAPTRCHSYNLTGARVYQKRRYTYQCQCSIHSVTSVIHNRVQRGQVYRCRNCKRPIKRPQTDVLLGDVAPLCE